MMPGRCASSPLCLLLVSGWAPRGAVAVVAAAPFLWGLR